MKLTNSDFSFKNSPVFYLRRWNCFPIRCSDQNINTLIGRSKPNCFQFPEWQNKRGSPTPSESSFHLSQWCNSDVTHNPASALQESLPSNSCDAMRWRAVQAGSSDCFLFLTRTSPKCCFFLPFPSKSALFHFAHELLYYGIDAMQNGEVRGDAGWDGWRSEKTRGKRSTFSFARTCPSRMTAAYDRESSSEEFRLGRKEVSAPKA